MSLCNLQLPYDIKENPSNISSENQRDVKSSCSEELSQSGIFSNFHLMYRDTRPLLRASLSSSNMRYRSEREREREREREGGGKRESVVEYVPVGFSQVSLTLPLHRLSRC